MKLVIIISILCGVASNFISQFLIWFSSYVYHRRLIIYSSVKTQFVEQENILGLFTSSLAIVMCYVSFHHRDFGIDHLTAIRLVDKL